MPPEPVFRSNLAHFLQGQPQMNALSIVAAISGANLLHALLWIVIAAVIWWLCNWLISYIGVPEPFLKICKVILAIAAVVFLVNALMTLMGSPLISW